MHRLLSCLLLLCSLTAFAEPAAPEVALEETDPYALELKAFVDGYVTARMHDRKVAGVTVSIVRDGKRVYSRGYGFDDHEKRRYVDSSRSLFRPGSISKTFTWTALMQLYEQGKIKLDTDIAEYLPQIQLPHRFSQPITVLDLMAHRPGFEDAAVGHLIIDQPDHVQTLVEYLQTHQPAQVYPPGTTPAYSNYGTGLAGLIVANKSGMPFEDYVEEHLFKPLGMTNSTFREPWGPQRPGGIPETLRSNTSKGYIRAGAGYEFTDYEFIGHVGPAGALATTADDMAQWMLAHLGNGAIGDARILKSETAVLMHQQSATTHPDLPGMAHGFIEAHLHGYRAFGHGGGTAHFLSDMVMVPDLGLGIFISTNTTEGGGRLIQGFARDFIQRFYPPGPLHPEATATTNAPRQDVAGNWIVTRRSHTGPEKLATPMLSISFDGDGNLIVGGLGEPVRYQSVGEDHYRSVETPDDQIIFERDERGEPVRLLPSIPILVGTRPGLFDRIDVNAAVLGFAALTFIGVLLCAWRRMGRGLLPLPAERRAAVTTTVASAVWLIALILLGLGATAMEDPRVALFHYPTPTILAALWGILLAVLLTAVALVLAIPALQGGTWSVWRRLRHVLVIVFALLVSLVLWNNNLVGFHHF